MIVNVCDTATAEIIAEHQLPFTPRWGLRYGYLVLGNDRSMEEYEHHVLQTIGSSNLYGASDDALRFDRTSLLLQSAWFTAIEVNRPFDRVFDLWRAQKPYTGLLRLTSPQAFQLDSLHDRWIDPDGTAFICFSDVALLNAQQRLRLRIARDFDLLFADQTLCGWMLVSPTRYITRLWSDPHPEEDDNDLGPLVHKYLNIVEVEKVYKMDDGDPTVLEELLELRQEAEDYRPIKYQRKILIDSINDVIEQFYS